MESESIKVIKWQNLELSDKSWQSFNGYEYGEYDYQIQKIKSKAKEENEVKRKKLISKLFDGSMVDYLSTVGVWEKIEKYLQEFCNDPDFPSIADMFSLNKKPSYKSIQWNTLVEIKKSRDRLKKPLIYQAAALLLANIEKWASPYRWLVGKENSGLWVRALLWDAHYQQFLKDKAKCINNCDTAEMTNSWLDKEFLHDLLATCEMNYIVNNIRWTNWKADYFWYHKNLPWSLLPNQFADKLSQISCWRFTKSSVKEIYENFTYNDFDIAKNDFRRLFKTSRFPWALASLGKMLSLVKNDGQRAECQKSFLICMLSWVLDFNGKMDIKKQVYSWGKTLWFLPWMLAKNVWHSEQVVVLLDDFSNWDFSNKVKSFFHRSDLLKWEIRIWNLIEEVDRWWSIDMMYKFEKYSKTDFLSKNFLSDLALRQLQKSVLSFDNVDIDRRELGRDANVLQLKEKEKKERVQDFINNNCSEPIEWVDRIVPFNELAKLLVKSAGDLVKNKSWYKVFGRIKSKRVLKSIKEWNAKDKWIYELPAYKQLIEKWFILPSDVRTYYDSANRKPVYHLWVDYNVKWWTEVKSMYDWKVVKSWLDGWLWHKVIIEHTMPDWTRFYSLYGHLGHKGLPKVWQIVEKWMKIWEVWEAFTANNWNWNSHLHFQIMENINSKRWYSKTEWEWNYDVLKSFGKK